MQLEQEKFNAVKELSEISVQISEGRAALSALRVQIEEYLTLREDGAHERVSKVLRESRGALEETSKNHQELVSYKNELTAYATEIKGFANTLTTLFQDFTKRMEIAHEEMGNHFERINQDKKDLKVQRVNIEEDRKQLSRDRDTIFQEARLIKDKRETLDRAWEEFRKLTKKS